MIFHETSLQGAFVLEPEAARDDRGYFTRVWCSDELAEHGLNSTWVQSSVSYNDKALTLRGMHYQVAPHEEAKLVRCTAGAVFDVIIDLRSDSATYGDWFSVDLSPDNNLTLYVPAGLAHGFLTTEDISVVEYHMSEVYSSGLARGVRWDDPTIAIPWPASPVLMSDRDRGLPTLDSLSPGPEDLSREGAQS